MQLSQNTTTHDSTSSVVTSSKCMYCQTTTHPYLRPAIPMLGIDSRWIDAKKVCQDCEDKIQAQTEAARKKRADQERIERAFKSARISPRFCARTFENFKPSPENTKAFDAAKNYEANGGGILFFGPCGTGKTHLASAIANKYIAKISVLFISCPELLIEIRESMNGKKNVNSLEAAKSVDLLIIDDIGAEKASEWVRETLFVLINHRYEHRLSTVITTNCTLNQIAERLGDRTASRLVEMCKMVSVDGVDYRFNLRLK